MITSPLGSRLAADLSLLVSLPWAFDLSFGDWVLGLVAAVAGTAVRWWAWLRNRDEAALVATALRTHRDPGPGGRETVDRETRVILARPTWTSWAPLAIFGAMAAGCVIVAVARPDAVALLPGALLLLGAALLVHGGRQDIQRATRWLAEPPHGPEQL